MSARHTFTGVTPDLLARLARARRGPIQLDFNADGRTGTASGKLPLGLVEIGFSYASERSELTLTVLRKPMFVPTPILWAEFSLALREASAL
jgi:hypothetical protein